MANAKEFDKFDDYLAKIAATAVVILFATAILYFWRFGRLGLSDDQSHWGQFGDFLGGTVNPILSFMSLLVLVSTLQVQRRVLQDTRKQSARDELQRLIASTAKSLDENLDAAVDLESDLLGRPALAHVGRRYMLISPPEQLVPLRDALQNVEDKLRANELSHQEFSVVVSDPAVKLMFRHLMRLDWCIRQFRIQHGDQAIADFYGSEYATPSLMAFRYGHFTEDSVTNMGLGAHLLGWKQLPALS